ncbi:translation initiation factor IF-2 [Abyssisolibacter fermentans]|uniref:translation initiation factor IF-2 n=1 Tax=Abyssisolibacter fermentans TaxID=1766203 RepID=UPI00082A72AB|nr:translation initiation factor IF-2 [Abyssisolibacter fermentans]
MTKKRIYQIAKELDISSKKLISQLKEVDVEVNNHMSTVDDELAKIIEELFSKKTDTSEQQKQKEEEVEEIKKEEKVKKVKKNEKAEEKKNEDNSEDKKIEIDGTIIVKDFAEKLSISSTQLISKLMSLGVMASVNQEIDLDTASIIGEEYGFNVVSIEIDEDDTDDLDFEDDEKDLKPRSPVVTVMGHVDHGKTSLLDYIRNSHIANKEAGGITQHIGASTVRINNKKIVFLDTPGHEAFTSMRARGAQITDIAILVVAADDGVMPQTIEAINHAKAAGVPIIVAVNKIDKINANPDRVKQELTEQGLVPEDWGGDTIMVPVSALKGEGVDELLEMVTLVAEMLELKANPNRRAVGTVIEAELNKGKGSVATVLVQKGTLKVSDAFIAGTASGKIRAMLDEKGKKVKKAGPSTAVEIMGISEVPGAGELFYVVENEKKARDISEKRRQKIRDERNKSRQVVSLDDLFDQIKSGNIKDLNIILKADVRGSIEAVRQSLEKLSNEEVQVKIIHGGVGAITESDVMLASASNAIVIGFNVRPTVSAINLGNKENVDIRTYRIIYKAIEDIQDAINGMLEPEFKEVVTGRAEIRATFKVPNFGLIAGVYVTNGKIVRNANLRLLRDNVVVYEGEIGSLKRYKDDVKELATGYEGGVGIKNFNDVKEGDVIEAFVMEEVKRK